METALLNPAQNCWNQLDGWKRAEPHVRPRVRERIYAQRCRGTQGKAKWALGRLLRRKEVHFRFAKQIQNLGYHLVVQHPLPRPELLSPQKVGCEDQDSRDVNRSQGEELVLSPKEETACMPVNPLGNLYGILPPSCPSWQSHNIPWGRGESESVPGRWLSAPGSLCARRGTLSPNFARRSALEDCAPACQGCVHRDHLATVNRAHSDSTLEKKGVPP